jgi:hypothetical protein
VRNRESADLHYQRYLALALGLLAGVASAQSVPWRFAVAALNGGSESALSNVATKVMGPGDSVTLSFTPPTLNTDGDPVVLTGYRFYAGTQAGIYTVTTTVNNPGLTSFVWANVAGTVPTPVQPPGPVLNLVVSPVAPSAARATLTFVWDPNSQFRLAIQNTGTATLQSVRLQLADQTFDWLRGASFTPANLDDNGDDIESPTVTFTTPVAPGNTLNVQGDIDTRNTTGITVTLTFAGLPAITKALTVTPTGFTGTFP